VTNEDEVVPSRSSTSRLVVLLQHLSGPAGAAPPFGPQVGRVLVVARVVGSSRPRPASSVGIKQVSIVGSPRDDGSAAGSLGRAHSPSKPKSGLELLCDKCLYL
jgi:hypothetical protein